MAPANAKANYKTYEAQARMVRAIVAAHPEVKWNYKEIAACYGSDMTDHALNHRFRKVRATVNIINDARAQGLDIKDLTTDENLLPSTQAAIDKNNIAKYFGQSTTDGIQFQFRTIKKDAESLRQTANDGGDVANCLNLGIGSGPNGLSTPSKPTPARGAGSRSGKGSKRKVNALPMNPIKRSASEDDEDDELNFDDLDHTPSKRVKTTGRTPRGPTPARSAARKAAATITDASVQYQDSESPYDDAPMPVPAPVFTSHPVTLPPSTTVAPTSLFGDVERKPPSFVMPPPGLDMMASTEPSFPDVFTGSKKNYAGPPPDDSSYMDWGDGEI